MLKTLQHHVVLMAVGQTIKTLHAEGIHPHFVTGVDPFMLPWFESDDYTREVLVCNTVFDPEAVARVPGRKIFVNYTQDIDVRMIPIVGRMGSVNNGGSVANFSYSIAKVMGFKTIAFVGQDLAYTDGASHAGGYIDREEKAKSEMANDSRFKLVPCYYGDMVYTNQQMDTYRDWFETQIKKDTAFKVYNCTEGGALIRGAIQIPLKEFVHEYGLLNLESPEIPAFPQKIDTQKVIKYLRHDLQAIHSAMELSKSGLTACAQTQRKPDDVSVLKKAKAAISKTQKFLIGMNTKNFNPYLTVLWNFALHEIAKSETAPDASPEEVIKPFIPFFEDLKAACTQSEAMLAKTIQAMKKGDPKVASARQLDAVI
jgi:hypothetical protein